MPLSSFLRPTRHPAAVALRLLLWPTAVLGLSHLVAGTEDDALAAGLTGLAVIGATAFLLALADGLVLRTRPLVLVWSVTTLVVVGLLVTQPLVDFLIDGPEETTWAAAVQTMLEDLPAWSGISLILVGVPVGVGAFVGSAFRRARLHSSGLAGRSTGLAIPRA